MGWDSYNSSVARLNHLKALNFKVKKAVSGINFTGKKFHICKYRTKNCTQRVILGRKRSYSVTLFFSASCQQMQNAVGNLSAI